MWGCLKGSSKRRKSARRLWPVRGGVRRGRMASALHKQPGPDAHDAEAMQELAHHAWEQHRLANRLIELPLAFILGDGVEVRCDNEEAQTCWTSGARSHQRLDLNLEKRVRELALVRRAGDRGLCWRRWPCPAWGH